MASQPIEVQQPVRFGENFELDFRPRRLRQGSRVLKLERIPLEILILLLERPGDLVSRDEIVDRIWGKGVFLDTDNSIRSAIRKIRTALKDDADQPRFIQTVTGQGYRFIAPIAAEEATEVDATSTDRQPTQNGQPTPAVSADTAPQHPFAIRSAYRWLVMGGLALVALLAGAYFNLRHRSTNSPAPIRSIAVLPLKNLSGDPSQEYLADGLTEELIGRLASIGGLRVISRTSSMQLKNTQLSVPQISRMLSVDSVVEGSVIREGNRVRVHAQLIRSATDEHFWSETYDHELTDVLGLESDVAEAIAKKVEVTVSGPEHTRLIAARHVSPEVYESYLKGRFALDNGATREDFERSIAYFNEAVKKDPTFAPAHLGLANAYSSLGTVLVGAPPDQTRPEVISEGLKALELDPELADAHLSLAGSYLQRWQWNEAKSEFDKALALKPNDARAHSAFAIWLLSQGRVDEAVNWARRAQELDPLASNDGLAWTLFQARRYDEALAQVRVALVAKPDDTWVLWSEGFVWIAKGQPEQAIPVLQKARSVSHGSPGITAVLISAYAHAGRRKEALQLLAELYARRKKGYVPAAAFLQAYLGLGDKEHAFEWLEQAYKEQSNMLLFLKTESTMDILRDDPRFSDMLRRVGLS